MDPNLKAKILQEDANVYVCQDVPVKCQAKCLDYKECYADSWHCLDFYVFLKNCLNDN